MYDLNKPQGFWFAVEYPDDPDDHGWYELCTVSKEGLMVCRVRYKYAVKIKKYAHILTIETEDQLEEFVKTYGYHEVRHETHPWSILDKNKKECIKAINERFPDNPIFTYKNQMDDIRIDWLQIYRKYHGIIIAPYHYNLREAWMWYNCWEVASGCVWDISIIESIELVEKKEIRKIKNSPYYRMK